MDKLKIAVLLGRCRCLGGGEPGHGKDRALGGLHDRLVGRIHTALQCLGPEDAVAGLDALQRPADAPEQQAQDYAGVAPGAPEHGRSRTGSGLLQGGILQLSQIRHGGADGHGHIGARIAVRHGEDVQLVDRLLMRLDGRGGLDHQLAEIGPVNCLPQNLHLRIGSLIRFAWNRYTHGPR